MEFKPPVKEGEELNVKIECIGNAGDGVAKIDKFVIFVKGGQVGEELMVRVTNVKPKFAFAKIIEEE